MIIVANCVSNVTASDNRSFKVYLNDFQRTPEQIAHMWEVWLMTAWKWLDRQGALDQAQ